jgi:hypothetical protein
MKAFLKQFVNCLPALRVMAETLETL